jgi:sigma-B regulation protein RsbU (phosphoserine phosphatase)
LVHTQDITERKQAENELKKLWNVVQQTADSIILTNKQGIIEYVNPAFEITTGYTREEAIGRTPQILKSGRHQPEFYQNLWAEISSGKPFRGTIVNRKKDGTFYWSEQTITPMKDENGNITNFVSVLKDITELKEKQEQEFQLRIARELQQRFYRADVRLPDFDIGGASYSAVETSGDYYDYISLPDGTLGIVIGDVSGHGIGPALIMAETRAFLRAFAKHESDPAVLLTLLNQELVTDLDSEHFVTLIFARLDFLNKTLDYASAGHVPAFILDAAAAVRCKLPATGVPLGIVDKYRYEKSPIFPLNPRDLVVFLTDGVIETVAENKQQFGFERTLEVIQHYHPAGAQEIVEQLYLAVRNFSQSMPQEDDITSIVLKVLPAAK